MAEYAVIIGINRYEDDVNIPKLKWAENDAYEFYKVLISPYHCGIPKQNIKYLLNENATKDNIIEGISELRDHIEESDTVFFFFAGHGCSEYNVEKGDKDDHLLKYLVPYDVQVDKLDAKAIDFNFLSDRFQRIPSERMLILLDCCYGGAAGGRSFSIPSRKRGTVPVKPSFLQKISGVGRVVISGCDSNELASELDELSHGIFSYYLIQGLRGDADIQGDGVIDLNELWTYLSSETTKKSEQKQHPVLTGMIKGPALILSHLRPSPTKESKEKLEAYLCIKYGQYRLQTVKITDDGSKEKLALEAARYLDERITHNFNIAVSCGGTLSTTISKLRKRTLYGVTIFPLNAFISDTYETIDSNFLISLFKNTFDVGEVTAHTLPQYIPKNVDTQVRNAFTKESDKIFAMTKDSDLFLFGIGQPGLTNANITRVLGKASLTPKVLEDLGVIGEIGFHLYDRDGQFLIKKANLPQDQQDFLKQYYRQFFAFSLDDLMEVTENSRVNLVAVAGGKGKREAILGAIKTKIVRTLITDFETAQWLYDMAI